MVKFNPLSKRYYMSMNTFWSDPHNKNMAELGEKLYKQREILAAIPKSDSDYFQKEDGTVALRKERNVVTKALSYFQDKFAFDMNKEYTDIRNEISYISSNVKFK